MPIRIIFILCLSVFYSGFRAQENPIEVVKPFKSPSLKFTENLGQWEPFVLFRAELPAGALYIEKDALTFSFYDAKKFSEIYHGALTKGKYKDPTLQCHAYKVHFENCNPFHTVEKLQEGPDYENFYLGKDENKWKSNVRNYHQVFLRNLYTNIDYEVLTAVNSIKYNFHVKPGGNSEDISLRYEGVENMRIKDGTLFIKLSINQVIEQKPFAYQMINGKVVKVPCRYVLKDKVLGFEFPKGYNKNYDLVIDPVLVFSAQSGSAANNFGMTATFDPAGNLYAGGTVFSNGYPVTFGAFGQVFTGLTGQGITDVAITKYNSSGTNLLYSTYIGGSQAEIVSSLIIDNSNNLCFYGTTGSSDFPMITGAFDPTFNGGTFLSFIFNGTTFNFGTDIYLGKFNSSGTSLLASTFLGGSGNDGVNHVNHLTPLVFGTFTVNEFVTDSLQFNYGDQYRGEIQIDAMNNIYITSSTRSNDFPTANAFDNTLGGKQDAVVCKLNSSLSQLLYSTYLGGTLNECGNSLIVNNNLEVYVTGGTCSSDFPATTGAYDVSYSGGIADGFLSHLNSSGNGLLQSTFIGTSQYDQSFFVQSDKYNQIYVYGQSLGNMPVITATNQITVFNVPSTHQFISRFNSTLSGLNMSTVFGNYTNMTDISPCAFAVDKCLNIYISGWGGDIINFANPLANMPLLFPTQSTTTGFDFYFMGLDSNAAALKYGSYFGGASSQEHVDGGTSRFDPSGKIYQSACAGCQNNDDWPLTTGAWPLTPGNGNHSSGCNNGVVKLDFQLQTAIATIHTATLAGCVPFAVTFTSANPPTNPGATFMWYLAPGQTNSTNLNPSITYTAPGIYTVSLVIRDNLTCNKKDSSITYITVYPKPTAIMNIGSPGCNLIVPFSNSSTGNLGPTPHFWNVGGFQTNLSSFTYTFPSSGLFNISYTVTDVNGCKDTQTTTLSVAAFAPGVVSSASMCAGQSATLNASGGTTYTWYPGTSLSNTNTASPVASPPSTTIYSVIIRNTGPGYDCYDTLFTQVIVHPNPTAGFTFSSSPCSNTLATTNNSSGNLGTSPYVWNFGNSSPPVSTPSPTYTYPGNGTYTLTLMVVDINGCTSVQTNTLAIFNFTPGVVNSSSLCYGNTTTLVAQGGTTYTWNPGSSLSNTQIANPSANPTVTTIYTVVVYNDSPGYTCQRTLTTQILVQPTPTANFAFSINPCGGGVNFTDQSADDIATWSWTLSPTKTSTVQNPYYFYNTGGNFTITLTTTNIYGCPNTISKPLGVPTPPPLTISSDTAICIGGSTQLDAEGGVSYDWTPPETLDFPTLHNPKATPTITTEYSVNITTSQVVGGNVCKFMLTTLVEVDVLSNIPNGAFANPTVITVGESSTLIYFGQAGAIVTWLPPGSTKPGTGYTVSASPDKPTTYTAVANRGACTEDVEVHVDAFTEGCAVKDFFVPNTFTPNGDGQNDLLYLRGIKADDIYFAIYNRWGEMVFETNDISKGWDGRFKGREADVGVFGWYYKAKCANGGETFSKGNVTLIR